MSARLRAEAWSGGWTTKKYASGAQPGCKAILRRRPCPGNYQDHKEAIMNIYSAPCTSCGGAHLSACGTYLRQIAHLLVWIASTGGMLVALITQLIS